MASFVAAWILFQHFFHFPFILNILIVQVGCRSCESTHPILASIRYLRTSKTLLFLLNFIAIDLHLTPIALISYITVDVITPWEVAANLYLIRLLAGYNRTAFRFRRALFHSLFFKLLWHIVHRNRLCKAIFRLGLVVVSAEAAGGLELVEVVD